MKVFQPIEEEVYNQIIADYLENLNAPQPELVGVYSPDDHLGETTNYLLANLETYANLVAESVHDAWSRTKVANGYTYGVIRNDDAQNGQLTHPLLVPYDLLSDVDKSYDENTARTVLEGLVRIWQEEN